MTDPFTRYHAALTILPGVAANADSVTMPESVIVDRALRIADELIERIENDKLVSKPAFTRKLKEKSDA